MSTCQNGWPALPANSNRLHDWVIPARNGHITIRLRNGSAGFLLALWLLWFAEVIQPLAGKVRDDWGWAWRPIRGQVRGLSNHAGGTACDANATQHPLGRVGTYTRRQYVKMRARLRWAVYGGCIRHGMDYHGRKDEMHAEIVKPMADCERAAKRLMRTWRGRRLLAANPGQRAVILS